MQAQLTLKDEPEKVINLGELNRQSLIKLHTYFPNLNTIKIKISASECHFDKSKETRAARVQMIKDLFSEYDNELLCPNLKKFTLEVNSDYPLQAYEMQAILEVMGNNKNLTEVDLSSAFYYTGFHEIDSQEKFIQTVKKLVNIQKFTLHFLRDAELQVKINQIISEKNKATVNSDVSNNPYIFYPSQTGDSTVSQKPQDNVTSFQMDFQSRIS